MISAWLHSYVALYVPTTVHLSQPTDTMEYVQLVQVSFCSWFGGATTQLTLFAPIALLSN